ncbi:hypothetical protein BpHYR1_011711 [Brachionus plicatilis]|uniref:Uncharacterized protein n=1 Tax=Brachionus plicatilis TaxID=10195 RepID=A0A3M7Q705_BRAPC|nr:hypothetical protein BpHYR1_011711 [Brachionus plicatilis]
MEQDIVQSISVNQFKNRLDKYRRKEKPTMDEVLRLASLAFKHSIFNNINISRSIMTWAFKVKECEKPLKKETLIKISKYHPVENHNIRVSVFGQRSALNFVDTEKDLGVT